MDLGFKRAFSSILDGHVTTFLGALILYTVASGWLKGFGNTLMIGTAWRHDHPVVFTPGVNGRGGGERREEPQPVRYQRRTASVMNFSSGNIIGMLVFTVLLVAVAIWAQTFRRQARNIIGNRNIFLGISGALIAICIIGMVYRASTTGFNLGMDFTGGTVIEVGFSENLDSLTTTKIASAIEEVAGPAGAAGAVGGDDRHRDGGSSSHARSGRDRHGVALTRHVHDRVARGVSRGGHRRPERVAPRRLQRRHRRPRSGQTRRRPQAQAPARSRAAARRAV